MDEPDVVEYLDYRAFLRDWFDARAGRPSVRGFARRAGCSASLVSSTIAGKRHLNTGRAEVWAQTMSLSSAQTSHLITLVVLAHDPSPERRQRAMAEALTRQHFHRVGSEPRQACAAEVLEGAPDTHAFSSSTLALPSSSVPELEARVAHFWEEITHWAALTEGERDRVYQLSLELVPDGKLAVALKGGTSKRARGGS